MAYDIDAWLDHGRPRLRIVDTDSGSIRMAWDARDAEARDPAVKALFRELLLLSALQHLGPQR